MKTTLSPFYASTIFPLVHILSLSGVNSQYPHLCLLIFSFTPPLTRLYLIAIPPWLHTSHLHFPLDDLHQGVDAYKSIHPTFVFLFNDLGQ